jgi:hypothetical protein
VDSGFAWLGDVDPRRLSQSRRSLSVGHQSPGFAENRHRTNAIEGHVLASHSLTASGATVAVGGSAGGDWITSSNLGDHAFSRMAVFAEAAVPLGTRATARGGVRIDHFSDFGSSTRSDRVDRCPRD